MHKQKKAKSLNEETVINLSNDDEAKTVTTATTPSTGPSTPSTGDPKKPKGAVEGEDEIDEEGGRRRVGSDATPLQPIQNGIRRQNSRASDERYRFIYLFYFFFYRTPQTLR